MNAIACSAVFTLACHPQTPSPVVHNIDVVTGMAPGGSLKVTFGLTGDMPGLRIPDQRPPRRGSDLWRHTCFELFVMADVGPGYREFNFSPSGEWAVYDFRRYRDGGELGIEFKPGILVRKSMNRLELDAEIFSDHLPPAPVIRVGMSAVVEDAEGGLSYWALQHPPGKPDFHHPDAFAFQMEPTQPIG